MDNKLTANEFLGGDSFVKKYEYIYPIIRLILYRLDTWGRSGLNPYDGKNPEDRLDIKHKLLAMSGKFFYCFYRLCCREKSDSNIMLSETIFKIGRYKHMNKELLQNKSVYRFCSEANCSAWSIIKDRQTGFQWKMLTPLYVQDSVTGKRVKKAAYATFDFFETLLKDNKKCKEEETTVNMLVDELQAAVIERVDFLCGIIQKRNIQAFVTFNQYNLSDFIFMMACKKMNVKRKVYFHYGFAHAPVRSNASYISELWADDKQSWDVNNELCFWTKSDILWWEKHGKKENWYGEKMKLQVIGCPEVTKSLLGSYRKKYPKSNIVTVSAPMCAAFSNKFDNGVKNVTYTTSDLEELKKWKKNIYYQFYKMAEKNNVKVNIRYHPSEPIFSRELDKDLMEEFGFSISEDTREGLFKSASESIATFGHSTSFSVISYIFGAKTVLIDLDDVEYDLCGYNMDIVQVEDIAEYVIKNDNTDHPDECFDLEKFVDVLS